MSKNSKLLHVIFEFGDLVVASNWFMFNIISKSTGANNMLQLTLTSPDCLNFYQGHGKVSKINRAKFSVVKYIQKAK